MSIPLSLAQSPLALLLSDLLSEEQLPALDRWFSHRSRRLKLSVVEQKTLWDALRKALTRGYHVLPEAWAPEMTNWPGFRQTMKNKVVEWTLRAEHPPKTVLNFIEAGIPGWLGGEFETRLGLSWSQEQTRRFLSAQETPTAVYVRFRHGAEGESCSNRFEKAGITQPSEVAGIAQLSSSYGIQGTEEWEQGLVEIQDASSQLSLVRLGLRPGQRVWDVCAGRGGKTLLAANELRGKGALFATDVIESKLTALKDRVRRSGWQNIRLAIWDGDSLPDFGAEVAAKGGFDRVIVDAPCSASGTWRRDPEGRFRLHPRSLQELTKHQQRLLRLGWLALKPGGRIVYITCSWLPSENEGVVEPFLAETNAKRLHQELLGLPNFDANTLFAATMEKPL